MLKAEQQCPQKPCMPSKEICHLRVKLMAEELRELADGFSDYTTAEILYGDDPDDLAEEQRLAMLKVTDGIGDLLYVTLGTAVACGIDIEPFFEEVHRSNMSKFIDGHRRADGKWVKGPSYSPANLEPILDSQSTAEKI